MKIFSFMKFLSFLVDNFYERDYIVCKGKEKKE